MNQCKNGNIRLTILPFSYQKEKKNQGFNIFNKYCVHIYL